MSMLRYPNRPCPLLPEAAPAMNHRCLTESPKDSPEFYLAAQRYGNFLWQKGLAGRALLALTRALYTDLAPGHPVGREWPPPYAAIRWIVAHHPGTDFPGNPRVSFQHQATRMRGPRQDRRRARAWAVWMLICQARPELPGDPDDPVAEPEAPAIHAMLEQTGRSGETELWHRVLHQPHV